MSHTPGPWKAWDDDGTGTTPCVLSEKVNAGGNFYVAECKVFDDARLIAAAPELYAALKYLNHMGGDERGGYCICPRNDGSAPDKKHSTGCADARAAIAKAEARP
jgi:hypothetical protein